MRPLTNLLSNGKGDREDTRSEAPAPAPLGGTRAQAMHRLQIGLGGLGAIVLIIGLANVIMDRANLTEAAAVPDAASTVAPEPPAAPQNDPLADAGVVPDLPTEPTPSPSREPAIMPEQGNAPGPAQ